MKEISKKGKTWLSVVIILVVALVFQFKDSFTKTDLSGVVTSVYDGDTFRVKIAEIPGVSQVRIREIDCFERKSPQAKKQVKRQMKRFQISEDEVYRRGNQAKLILEDLFKQTDNRIILKVSKSDLKDKYGRILAYVYTDGMDVSEKLLESHYCFPYVDPRTLPQS